MLGADLLGHDSYKTSIRWQQCQLIDVITPFVHIISLTFRGMCVYWCDMCMLVNMCQHTLKYWHIMFGTYITKDKIQFCKLLQCPPLTLHNGTSGNTTSVVRPRCSYTLHWEEGALTYSRDRINIQFPTSHYNTIKANLLLPLEHCFGWMLSGAPTLLWAQLRTFKHIKISQALHCPDYCLNIICFYILSLPLWLIFPLKLYLLEIFFSPLEGI